jgi:type IV pilus assembly protein PilW
VAPTAATMTVQKEEGDRFEPGVPLVISDCGNASIFVPSVFTADGSDKVATIDRSTGGGPPSNATMDLGANYMPGARIAPLSTVIYYIRTASLGTGTSLWRVRNNLPPEELVPGVVGMQVQYGVAAPAQMTIASYVSANAVTDWSRVISVTFALLMRSGEPNSPMLDAKTYSLLGVNYGPYNDRYQRSLFTTTVTLRNRTN